MTGMGSETLAAAYSVGRLHQGVAWLTVVACVAACMPAGLRWLRVAQREHYLGGSCARFAVRWWTVTPLNLGLASVALAAAARVTTGHEPAAAQR